MSYSFPDTNDQPFSNSVEAAAGIVGEALHFEKLMNALAAS